MRRILVAATVAALALGLAPARADAPQSFTGSIKMFTRFTDGESGWPGLGRQFREATLVHFCDPDLGCVDGPEHEHYQGIIAWVFKVDPATWGGAFTLGDVADLTGAADLDLQFYEDLGSTVWGETSPTTCVPESDCEFVTVAAGGESGFVPYESTYGIVYTRNGINSTFSYTAAAPVE